MSARPRVIQVVRSAGSGGVETHVALVMRRLEEIGTEPVLVSLASDPPHARFRRWTVHRLADRGSWGWRTGLAFVQLWWLLIRKRAAIVHLHGARPIFIGGLAAWLAGCKGIVCSLHGSSELMAVREDGSTTAAGRWVARAVHGIGFALCNRIVVCAERLRADAIACLRTIGLRAREKTIARKLRVVYHGIDAAQSGSEPTQPAAARTTVVVGTLSRLDEPKKGIAILLEAMARVQKAGVAVALRIAGDGYSRRALEKAAAALKLADCRFLGFVPDSAAFYRSLDAFVLASLSEGMPLVNLEAMASGVPVITTDVGGAAEAVLHEKTGLVVPPGNAEALAEAIVRLVRDPALARALASAGYERAHAEFTTERMFRNLLSVYNEVAAHPFPNGQA